VSGYLLDTDTSIEIMRGRNPAVLERLAATARDQVALSVVTVAELMFGAWRSQNSARNLEICSLFCKSFEILPLTTADAESSGALRATLETAGRRIGPYDVLIAGIALAESRVLVTHNTREFGRVRDLSVEDWLVAV
jgi:tRNA(fMet)-specific endonuclease VapC